MLNDAEFRREVEAAMRDDARLLAAMRGLLERAWLFVVEPTRTAARA